MCLLYVFVDLFFATKRLYTVLVDVDPAQDTLYVIATKRFLNQHSTLRVVSHIIVFLLLREFFISF
jgi:hypothetical protein